MGGSIKGMSLKITTMTTVVVVIVFSVWLFANLKQRTEIADLRGNQEVSIVLTDEGYRPRNVLIDVGTRVTFSTTRNNNHWPASNLHPSHEIYSEFDPKRPLGPSEEWTFIFNKKGEWGMHDHIRSYYTGVIYVSE